MSEIARGGHGPWPPIAIVTGAAGALGSATVGTLVSDGYQVVAFDRSKDGLAAAADGWAVAGLSNFETAVVDQTDRAAVDEMVARVAHDHGGIAGLVANAGYAKFGSILEMPTATWQRHVDVNLTGTFHMLQAVARRMAEVRNGGWITVISSNLATSHSDQVGAYCITKAAVLNLVRSAAAELGVHRIRVNAVMPGVVDTAMTHGMLAEPGVREGLIAQTPLGRLGTTEDITNVISFLASPAADWMTGASLVADGGQGIYGQPAWIRQDRTVPHQPTWVNGYTALHDNS
jgi:NAD(P)-dependent dehydrogenase (short-subunit alcohol dehydrogenase family)